MGASCLAFSSCALREQEDNQAAPLFFSVSEDPGLARNRGRRDLDRRLGQFPVFDGTVIGLVGEPSGEIAGYLLRRNHFTSTASHASPKPPIMV